MTSFLKPHAGRGILEIYNWQWPLEVLLLTFHHHFHSFMTITITFKVSITITTQWNSCEHLALLINCVAVLQCWTCRKIENSENFHRKQVEVPQETLHYNMHP